MDALQSLAAAGPVDFRTALTSLSLAFALSQVVAQVYMRTFHGLSYSRTFVQGVALGSIVTCSLMLAIGDSLAAGVGLAGGMSIVRFRTTMRDPRDMIFIFASLGIGVVCGLGAYAGATATVMVFAGAAWLLQLTSYGVRQRFDGLVRFTAPARGPGVEAVSDALRRHTRHHVLVTLRELAQSEELEHAYQVSVPDPASQLALVAALESVTGLHGISLHMQEPTLEL